MLRVQSRALRPWRHVRSQVRSVFRWAPAQILRSISMNADTRQNLSRRSSRQRQSIGPSGRAVRNGQRRRGFGFALDNVQERRQLWRCQGDGCAIRRGIIRYGKTWAWQVGVSDFPVKGAGPTFAPRRGVAHAPVAFAPPRLTSDTGGAERRQLQTEYGTDILVAE
jgi:hypothetical protein